MAQKIVLSLLSIMLVAIVICNAFDIPYNDHEFMSIVVDTESGLQKVATTIKTLYRKAKTSVTEFFTIMTPDFLFGQPSWRAVIETIRDGWYNLFDGLNQNLAFVGHYGFNPFSEDWWGKYNYFDKIQQSPLIYNDDGSYNWTNLDDLFTAKKTGVFPDRFSYIQFDYQRYLDTCYREAVRKFPAEYDLFIISKETIEYKNLTEEKFYSKLISHNNPVMAFKIPKVRIDFDDARFAYLYSDRDFGLDYLTSYRFPIYTVFTFDLSDMISLSPTYITFSPSSAMADNRIVVQTPIYGSSTFDNIFGMTTVSSTVDSGTYDCVFMFDYNGMYLNKSGYALYELYLKSNDLSETLTPNDFAYPAHYGYFVSSDILAYDTQGLFDPWF